MEGVRERFEGANSDWKYADDIVRGVEVELQEGQ